jgi:cytochrome c oxidase subunit III
MAHTEATAADAPPEAAWPSIVTDWSADKQTFRVPWGKAMMWIFLLSDTFIFTCFLTGYMNVRVSTPVPWPNPSEVFGLDVFGVSVPLLLIGIMTFDLITSSGTMALAVNFGYRRDRGRTAALMFLTAAFGAVFVSMQAFEWTKLIVQEGVRPWGNPMGASQFGATFFMITGFHGLHVSAGVVYLCIVASKVLRGDYEKKGYEIVEIAGLYWHFVDLVWVFIFAFFYLW